MKHMTIYTGALCLLTLLPLGCDTKDNTDANYKTAINDHYKSSPACIWPESKKLPAQETTSDDAKTEGYDALTQAGLLTRTTAEKKVFIVASKQVNNYDLSESGRTTWTPDSAQPGYGNFCYGHREVTAIDSSTLGTSSSGMKTASVHYHYKIGGLAGWANSPEMKTAFPSMNAAGNSDATDTATLVMNGNQWVFSGQ